MTIKRRMKFRRVEPSERGFEVVDFIKEEGGAFVLVKIRLEDLSKLTVLRTDKERREYQREAQRKYRERLAAKQKKEPCV